MRNRDRCRPKSMGSVLGSAAELKLTASTPIRKPALEKIAFAPGSAKYDNAMSMNGVRHDGRELFVARLCDGGCVNGRHVSASTVLFGSVACAHDGCTWASDAREVKVGFTYNRTRRFFNGPASHARYRVYLSADGILNNLLAWKPPNDYRVGDLLIHFAGPDKAMVPRYMPHAYNKC